MVKPKSYTGHDPTVMYKQDPVEGEPDYPEYRIETKIDDSIFRIESSRSRNVIITSLLLIKVDFLEECQLSGDKVDSLMNK